MIENLDIYTLNLVAACLSMFGSLAIIFNYLIFIKKTQLLYKLIVFLSLADFGGSLTICISQILIFLYTYDHTSYGFNLCKGIRASVNFFFVSSFFWTAAIALHFWVSAKQKSQIPLHYFHIVCWGLPALFVIIILSTGMINEGQSHAWCSNTELGHWLFWYSPLLISFVWNALLYTLIILHYRGSDRKNMTNKIKLRVSLYLIVFFVCWIWDLVGFWYEQATNGPAPNWIRLLTSTFMPLQGFLNFLVYGISSQMFCRKNNKRFTKRSVNSYNEQRYLLDSPSLTTISSGT